ncbi:hypothetical protein D3C87_1538350 [compost metagenome]
MGLEVDMLPTPLNSAQRAELVSLKKRRDTPARTLEIIELVLLADAGWPNDRIATHVGRSESWVQHRIRDYVTRGLTGLYLAPRKPRSCHKTTPEYRQALLAKLEEERIWSAPQLSEALVDAGFERVHPDHLRSVLHELGFRYKRTKKSVAHSRKPEVYEARREILDGLKKICPRW